MVANFCAWPLGMRLPLPSRQPSFSSTPTASVRSWPRVRTKRRGILRGDTEALSNSSPKVMEVEAANCRFLPLFLLSDLFHTLISSFEVTLRF